MSSLLNLWLGNKEWDVAVSTRVNRTLGRTRIGFGINDLIVVARGILILQVSESCGECRKERNFSADPE